MGSHIDGIKELIGQTIQKVLIADDKSAISLFTERNVFTLKGDVEQFAGKDSGDSWVDDQDEDFKSIIGGRVLSFDERKGQVSKIDEDRIRNNPRSPYFETSKWYFYEVQTTKGLAVVRFFVTDGNYYSGEVVVEVKKR